jgi:hypothetical protein
MRCFRRDEIAFPDGSVDRETQVYWLQTRSSYGDLRVPPRRPHRGAAALADYDLDELQALGRQQGSFGACRYQGNIATWDRRVGYQAVVHFPEPGIMTHDGSILIEDSPSGAYRERWAPLAGSETGHQCFALHAQKCAGGGWAARTGGVVVAGDYAMLIVDRPAPVPKLVDLDAIIAELWPNREVIAALLDCEFSLGMRRPGTQIFDIRLSTLPFREDDSFTIPDAAGDYADRSQGELLWRRWEDAL